MAQHQKGHGAKKKIKHAAVRERGIWESMGARHTALIEAWGGRKVERKQTIGLLTDTSKKYTSNSLKSTSTKPVLRGVNTGVNGKMVPASRVKLRAKKTRAGRGTRSWIIKVHKWFGSEESKNGTSKRFST